MPPTPAPLDPDARPYRGRFAPTPSGPLHRGSLVAALASWLDARAHAGSWIVRIEDLDPPRQSRPAAMAQLACLQRMGLVPDGPVLWQSTRSPAYQRAVEELAAAGRCFACTCTRAWLARAAAGAQAPYPGTCRDAGHEWRAGRSLRFRVEPGVVRFTDRAMGEVSQDVQGEVGDFVLRRSDGLWAYQLAVVVDDAWQGVTDVVRGADLLDNTPRQIELQRALRLPTPRYLHLPLVLDARGRKLSKSEGADALDEDQPLVELERAYAHLGFAPTGAATVAEFLETAVRAWRDR